MKENKDFAEMMEMKTNKLAKDIVHLVYKEGLQPMPAIVSIIKASAIIMESYKSIGEDADSLEELMKNCIGPARIEFREKMKTISTEDLFEN